MTSRLDLSVAPCWTRGLAFLPQADGFMQGCGRTARSRVKPGTTWIGTAKLILSAIALAFAALGLTPAQADDTMPPAPYAYRQLDDPKLEAKAQSLMETIRCLTCQSQSIADSDASMAGDMRSEIRERIAAGEQPEAIRQWLIQRYGDYITYTPRVTRLTWPLFAAPAFILLVAALLLRRRFKRNAAGEETGA